MLRLKSSDSLSTALKNYESRIKPLWFLFYYFSLLGTGSFSSSWETEKNINVLVSWR